MLFLILLGGVGSMLFKKKEKEESEYRTVAQSNLKRNDESETNAR